MLLAPIVSSAAGLAAVVLLAAAPAPALGPGPGPAPADAIAGLAGPQRGPAPVTVAVAGPGAETPRFVERPGVLEFTGRLLVRPKSAAERQLDGVDAADADALDRLDRQARERLAPHLLEHVPGPDRHVVAVPPGRTENEFAAELMATGDYAFAHPDWRCFPLATPNDPQFDQQWHHQTMESEAGWEIGTGVPQVIIAFIDTGVDQDHEDLVGRLVPGFNSVDDIPQEFGGDVSDVNGHGTAVGGSAGASGDNGLGVAGMGWNLGLMPVRTSNSPGGGASLGNILQGAEWAIENGARASSCSYTGIQSAAIQDSGAYIRSLGGLLLYAANNSNQDHAGFDWEDVIVVGATDQADDKAGFSSYGLGVDIFAPGVAIRTTANGGDYTSVNGTSFATPIANGVVGLIWSIDPSLTPDEVEQILYFSADDKGVPGNDDFWGWGRINVRRAAELAGGFATPQPPTAVADSASTAPGFELVIDVLANDYDVNLDELTIGSADATSALGGLVTIEPGAGPDGRDVLRYVPPTGAVGLDSFAYAASDGQSSSSATVTVDLLDPALFRAPDAPAATAPGSTVAYYALEAPSVLPDFDQLEPYATDIVDAVSFPSTGGDFATSGRADDVGAVFEGFIEVPAAALYILSVDSDDGSKLFLGEELIVDNDGLHGMVEIGAEVALLPGRHAVRVEFFERGGGAGCIVRIEGGGVPRQAVPPSMWSHEIEPPCPADVDGTDAVDFADVLAVLAAWGPCAAGEPCAADADGDGTVAFGDVLTVLAAWGPCTG